MEQYSHILALEAVTHTKKNTRRDEVAMYRRAAGVGASPKVIEVIEESEEIGLVTYKYPYSLDEASRSGVKLSAEAKLSLEAKMKSVHLLGILHRDITEENFVCNLDGTEAYIIDFGLSVRVDSVSLSILRAYIEDFEQEEVLTGDRTELASIAKRLEIRKLANLLKHF